MELKLGTFNVCHCGDYEARKDNDPIWVSTVNVETTARRIKALDLDIIGLNEVYEEGPEEVHFYQTEKLAKIAGYKHYVFAKGAQEGKIIIGNSILSKYPILNVERIAVPTIPEQEREEKGWYEDRVLLVVDVEVNGEKVRVIESHFGCTKKEREKIVKAACEVIDNSDVTALMGDFNAHPDWEELGPLYERMTSAADVMNNTEYTFASYNPHQTIDYIFVKKGLIVKDYTVHKVNTSDHFPISAKIQQ